MSCEIEKDITADGEEFTETTPVFNDNKEQLFSEINDRDSHPSEKPRLDPERRYPERNTVIAAYERLLASVADQEEIRKNELSEQTQRSIEVLTSLLDASNQIQAATQKELELTSDNLRLLNQSLVHDDFVVQIESLLDRFCETLYFFVATGRFCSRDKWCPIPSNSKKTDGIEIRVYEDLAVIHMPYIPGKYRGNYSIINERLESALRQCKTFPKWKRWKAEFIHVFPTKTKWIPRDVNNYDYKRTVDVIALAMRADDNCLDFEMAMRAIFSDKIAPGTYIEISPNCSEKTVFPKWK